jgi:hypothetical protein
MSRKECLGDDLIWIVFVADAMIWIAVEESYAVACSLLEDFLTQGGSTSSASGENSVTFAVTFSVTISDILIYVQLQKCYITSTFYTVRIALHYKLCIIKAAVQP